MASKKRAPSIQDPELNRIVSDIYKDINSLIDDVNHPSITHRLEPSAGKAGDIRLYEDTALAGGTSYYLQGKFKDGWASVNLGLQSVTSDAPVGVTSDSSGLAGITLTQAKAIVLYTTLAANNQIGETSVTVARGSHGHTHLELEGITEGNATHAQIDAHLNLGPSTFTATDALIHAISGDLTGQGSGLGLTAANGDDGTWARTDHKHAIDQGIIPSWTGAHHFDAAVTHHANVTIGEVGDLAQLTINNGTGLALDITGNVNLDGTLSIVYSTANEADLTVEGHTTLDKDVTINDNNTIATNTTDFTTTIKGDVISYGDVTLGQEVLANHKDFKVHASTELMGNTFLNLTGSDDSHNKHALEIKKDLESDMEHIKFYISDATKAATLNADTGGNMIIGAQGNIQLFPNDYEDGGAMVEGAVLPKGTRIADLGAYNRLWRTGYFAEIYAETLVAQDVLATIGGRIMVAPTSIVEETVTIADTELKLKHNNFFPGDYAMFKAAPAGLPCFEVMQVTEGPTYRPIGAINLITELEAVAGHQAETSGSMRDLYAERNLQILIECVAVHNLDDGDFVLIQGTGGNAIDGNGYDGAYKVAYLTGSSDPAVTSEPCDTKEFAISAPFVTGNTTGGSIKGPPFTYTVRRNRDNTLPNQWNIGDACVNLGYKEGDGYIELTSTETLHNALGPQMAIFSRTGTNLVSNSGFDSDIAGWTLGISGVSNDTITHNTDLDHVYTGSGSIKLHRDSGVYLLGIETDIERSFAVDDELVIEAWVKTTITTGATVALTAYDDSDWDVADTSTTAHMSSENCQRSIDGATWQRMSWLIKCTSGGEAVTVILTHGEMLGEAPNVVGDIYIDNVSVYVNPVWNGDAPAIAVGNLNNYVDYNTDSRNYFGMAVGNDLTKTSTTGFKGLTSDGTNGLRLFNTDLSLYASASLKFHSGIEDIDGNERVFFRMGDVATTPQFDWSWNGTSYMLTLDGASLQITGTVPSNIANSEIDTSTFLTGTSDLDWNLITAVSMPDWVEDIVPGPDEAGALPRIAIGNTFIGFYKGWGTTTNSANWPIRIANNSDNAEFWLGAAEDATYLSYIGGVGLTIKGTITASSSSDFSATDLATTDDLPDLTSYSQIQTFEQDAEPTGGTYNPGDTWINTTAGEGNRIYTYIGSSWTETMTVIDGGNISSGNITGRNIYSSLDTNETGEPPITEINMGEAPFIKQYEKQTDSNWYSQLRGGEFQFTHIGTGSDLTYKYPRAFQIALANNFYAGEINTFALLGLTNMYDSNYEVIPVPKQVIATGEQNITDLNVTNGIAREEVEYDISDKTTTGFKMVVNLRRGEDHGLSGTTGGATGSDLLDSIANNTSNGNGQQQGQTGGTAWSVPTYTRDYDYTISSGQFTWISGVNNSSMSGGANKFKLNFKIEHTTLLGTLGASPYYYPYPGNSYYAFAIRIGEYAAGGSNYNSSSNYKTVTATGGGGDYINDQLKQVITGVQTWSQSADSFPGGYDSWQTYTNVTVSFNTDDFYNDPMIQLHCYEVMRDNAGGSGVSAYHSPKAYMSVPGGGNNDIIITGYQTGQAATVVDTITGTGKVGALIVDTQNTSTGDGYSL